MSQDGVLDQCLVQPDIVVQAFKLLDLLLEEGRHDREREESVSIAFGASGLELADMWTVFFDKFGNSLWFDGAMIVRNIQFLEIWALLEHPCQLFLGLARALVPNRQLGQISQWFLSPWWLRQVVSWGLVVVVVANVPQGTHQFQIQVLQEW